VKAKTQEKIRHEEEVTAFQELFFAKMEALWNELEFFKKLCKVPGAEADKLELWWLYCFAAEMGAGIGQTKEEFMAAVGSAFDETESEEEDETEEEEETDNGFDIVTMVSPVSIASIEPAKDAIRSLIENQLGETKDDA
jgi:hypothetical protein